MPRLECLVLTVLLFRVVRKRKLRQNEKRKESPVEKNETEGRKADADGRRGGVLEVIVGHSRLVV